MTVVLGWSLICRPRPSIYSDDTYSPRSISGLSYVGTQATATGNPSIVSMSLGGNANPALDDAVNKARIGE